MKNFLKRQFTFMFQQIRTHKKESLVIGLVLASAIVFHGWNMFQFPYFENDEATYSSRGWSFITTGELDVYTYRYDHAPLGWISIGSWFLVSGGTLLFDTFLSSGRVLMLVVHVIAALLTYLITKRMSGGSRMAGLAAATIFSVSPIGIYFQRRILLDNLMVLGVLGSIYFLTKVNITLKDYIKSAIIFGVAVLIKLNAVFLGPALLYMVWARADKKHRVHAVGYWMAFCGLTIGSFFLYALLKNELLSAPIGSDGLPTRVSVVDTFKLQLGRGDFMWPWNPRSSFRSAIDSWLLKDNITLIFGLLASVAVTVAGVLRRKVTPFLLASGMMIWFYMMFLARGKLVLDLYVAPLIPLLAINSGLVIGYAYNRVKNSWLRALAALAIVAGFVGVYGQVLPTRHFSVDETTNQQQAVNWVLNNVNKDATIVTDNYAYPQLAQQSGYKHVYYFFNAEYDPEVKEKYGGDWRNVDYFIVTHEIMRQIKSGEVPIMHELFDHSQLVADFRDNSSSFIDIDKYISTNGDWAQVYKVKSRSEIVLQDSWDHFLDTFVEDYGQVVDTTNGDITTSSDQALAMQQALSQNDPNWFKGFWQWSKDHMRYRQTDKMLSWLWRKDPVTKKYSLGDTNTVCAADQKLAYLLYQAGDKWQDQALLDEAKTLTDDWWRQCVFSRGGNLYVDSSADGSIDDKLLNPGYFNPVMYRYLSIKTPFYDWSKLISDGYAFLERVESERGSIPNWIVLRTDGSIASAVPLLGAQANGFGVDSLNLLPTLATDAVVNRNERAQQLLELMRDDVSAYQLANPKSLQANVSFLILLQVSQSDAEAQKLYEEVVFADYDATKGTWGDGKDFTRHAWLWQWHELQQVLPGKYKVNIR